MQVAAVRSKIYSRVSLTLVAVTSLLFVSESAAYADWRAITRQAIGVANQVAASRRNRNTQQPPQDYYQNQPPQNSYNSDNDPPYQQHYHRRNTPTPTPQYYQSQPSPYQPAPVQQAPSQPSYAPGSPVSFGQYGKTPPAHPSESNPYEPQISPYTPHVSRLQQRLVQPSETSNRMTAVVHKGHNQTVVHEVPVRDRRAKPPVAATKFDTGWVMQILPRLNQT